MMVIETDQPIPDEVMKQLGTCDHILQVVTIAD